MQVDIVAFDPWVVGLLGCSDFWPRILPKEKYKSFGGSHLIARLI
jgi:hypothetical protein